MNDLLEKTRALEAAHRKPPENPRTWAIRILAGEASIEQVPDQFRVIVQDHLTTHTMMINAYAERIWILKNGEERLNAFNKLKAKAPEIAEAVSKRIKQLKAGG